MLPQDRALDRTKIALMTSGSPFLVSLALNLHHSFTDYVETAETDGLYVYYNPKFFLSLPENQRLTLMLHEVWHVALLHMFRCKYRDPEKYNRAADYTCNQILKDAGYEPIPNWLQDDAFKGLSTNEIYELIPDEGPEYNPLGNDVCPPPLSGNPDEDLDDVRANIEQKIITAQVEHDLGSTDHGDLPAELQRRIQKLLNPALPWEEILQRFMQDQAKNDYSWTKPNKRFMPDFYMPSMHSERLEHLTFAIDTSGSVTSQDMVAMLTEINYIQDIMKPHRMTILDCDVRIHNVYEVHEGMDIMELQFSGGGGTRCDEVIEFCKENQTTALVYFTDLYMPEYPHPIDFPLLWIVYNNPNRTKVNIGEITHYDIKGSK
jgi:predicted metal-dependent peptidase